MGMVFASNAKSGQKKDVRCLSVFLYFFFFLETWNSRRTNNKRTVKKKKGEFAKVKHPKEKVVYITTNKYGHVIVIINDCFFLIHLLIEENSSNKYAPYGTPYARSTVPFSSCFFFFRMCVIVNCFSVLRQSKSPWQKKKRELLLI